jgi:phospholipid/cholesterol/gamma-HCH transport system permease protein
VQCPNAPPHRRSPALTLAKPATAGEKVVVYSGCVLVPNGLENALDDSARKRPFWLRRVVNAYLRLTGRELVSFLLSIQGLGAFALISLGVLFSKAGIARVILRPLVVQQISRAGLQLLPMATFLAFALGFMVIGQTVSVLNRVGAQQLLGIVMVTAVVRELGPLLAAILVLSRTGTATVVELGTARAMGEVEALEVLGIDPIHYFVIPRLLGMATAMFSLTVYLILGALLSGYLWVFIQDIPLLPGEYFRQMVRELNPLDFVVLFLKTASFGALIALVSCFHGLAQPLSITEVSRATVRAVGQSIVFCALLEAAFIVIYLIS